MVADEDLHGHAVDNLARADLGEAVQQLKQEPGTGLFVGGVTLPLALAAGTDR